MPNSEGRSILAVPSRLTRPPSRSSSWPSRATRPKAAPPKSGPKPSPTFISSSLNAYLPREIASYTKNLTVSRHAAEIPERFLNASDERFESLAECERYPSPAAEAEHKLKEQMPQQATCNRHSQIGRVREVERPLAPGYVPLLEVHFLRRTVERTPVANATLQRPKLADAETTRVALLQYVDDRGCLENALRVARQ